MAEDASESEYIPFKRKRLDSPEDKKSDDEKHIILNITDSIADAKDQTDEPKVGGSGSYHAENGKVKDDTQPQNLEEDDDDDDDNLSTISNLSDLMKESWRPTAGPMMWIHTQMMMGTKPLEILSELIPDTAGIPDDIDDLTLWKIIINIMSEPERRNKLKNYNTLDDAIQLLQTRENIIVLTGAGVSVSCGIPDFRSRDGIYARLAVEFPDLPDPQAMFDIKYFKNDPRPFFKFAKEIYPGQFEPSNSHKFIKLLEDHKKLLRNYTQNIDTLEQVAGIQNVIQCHGSFAEATCMQCRRKVKADAIREDIFNQVIPHCTECPKDDSTAVMKPDIVFFGESLSDEFHKQMAEDKKKCDLLIVIGSSLKVRPVSLIPHSLPGEVPQILINREPHKHNNFDIELLGDCDTIISEICKRLGTEWESLTDKSPTKTEIHQSLFNKKRSKEKKKDPVNLPSKSNDHQHLHENEKSKLQNISESENAANSNETKSTESETHQNTEVKLPIELESVATEQKSTEKKDSGETGLDSENKSEVLPTHKTKFESTNEETKKTAQNESERTHDLTSQSETKSGETPDDKQTAGGSNEDLAQMRKMWQPKNKESLAKQLEDDQYLFIPPSQYVFHGAEIYSEDEISDDDFRFSSNSSSSSSSIKSDEDKEEESEMYASDEEDIDECENQSTESTEHLEKSYSETNEPICLSERDSLSSSSSRFEDNIPSEENS